jgi:hypothetical protein
MHYSIKYGVNSGKDDVDVAYNEHHGWREFTGLINSDL